jgi:serine O-acetyltransferase
MNVRQLTLEDARELIWEDVREWKRLGYLSSDKAEAPVELRDVLRLLWNYAGLRATVWYRLSHAAHRRHIPLLPGMMARMNLRRYGLDIVSGVPIGPGLYIPHPVGTVVMAVSIGSHCHLISGVTIGMRTVQAFPRIGDNVTVSAGARVLGDISVGHGATIGANAVVISDVPDGATMVGAPARPTGSPAPHPEPVYAGEPSNESAGARE